MFLKTSASLDKLLNLRVCFLFYKIGQNISQENEMSIEWVNIC